MKIVTESEALLLPVLIYPPHAGCDICGRGNTGTLGLQRDLNDYEKQPDGKYKERDPAVWTALYLCSSCHWTQTCKIQRMFPFEDEVN